MKVLGVENALFVDPWRIVFPGPSQIGQVQVDLPKEDSSSLRCILQQLVCKYVYTYIINIILNYIILYHIIFY